MAVRNSSDYSKDLSFSNDIMQHIFSKRHTLWSFFNQSGPMMMASFKGIQWDEKAKYLLSGPGVCLMTQVLQNWGHLCSRWFHTTKQFQSYLFHKGGYQPALVNPRLSKPAISVLM